MGDSKETDILYIGCTKCFGGIESNSGLWVYHKKATAQGKRIINYVISLDEKEDMTVKICWT